MDPLNFAYWLNGYFEIHGVSKDTWLTPSQVGVVCERLKEAFKERPAAPAKNVPFPPLVAPGAPATTWDWRQHMPTCAADVPQMYCCVEDDVEAGEGDGVALGQNLGGFARAAAPAAFAPIQVGGFAAETPLPSC